MLVQKRTLFISDHKNNQLLSRITKRADQENWDTTHPLVMMNRAATRQQQKTVEALVEETASEGESEADNFAI
jgi:hypothetical protein